MSAPRPAARANLARLDRRLQLLRRTEGDLLAGLDRDRLPGCGIAAGALGLVLHFKDAKAADAQPIAAFQVVHQEPDQVGQNRLGLPFRDLLMLRDLGGELL